MKRMIYSANEDWQYNSDNEINALKETMNDNIDRQEDPEVGIFWYDVNSQSLFGVKSADVNDVKFYHSSLFDADVKTCVPLHYKVWEKEQYRAKDKRFLGDYTRVPRGRVFYIKDQGFVVVVGDWINDYPEAKPEILSEFNLPKDTEFRIDKHWSLGHGWSDKFA